MVTVPWWLPKLPSRTFCRSGQQVHSSWLSFYTTSSLSASPTCGHCFTMYLEFTLHYCHWARPPWYSSSHSSILHIVLKIAVRMINQTVSPLLLILQVLFHLRVKKSIQFPVNSWAWYSGIIWICLLQPHFLSWTQQGLRLAAYSGLAGRHRWPQFAPSPFQVFALKSYSCFSDFVSRYLLCQPMPSSLFPLTMEETQDFLLIAGQKDANS